MSHPKSIAPGALVCIYGFYAIFREKKGRVHYVTRLASSRQVRRGCDLFLDAEIVPGEKTSIAMTELSPLKGPIGLLATAYDTPLDDVRLLTPVGIAIGETDCADADFANACRWIGGELEWSNYVNALDHAATLHKKSIPARGTVSCPAHPSKEGRWALRGSCPDLGRTPSGIWRRHRRKRSRHPATTQGADRPP